MNICLFFPLNTWIKRTYDISQKINNKNPSIERHKYGPKGKAKKKKKRGYKLNLGVIETKFNWLRPWMDNHDSLVQLPTAFKVYSYLKLKNWT